MSIEKELPGRDDCLPEQLLTRIDRLRNRMEKQGVIPEECPRCGRLTMWPNKNANPLDLCDQSLHICELCRIDQNNNRKSGGG